MPILYEDTSNDEAFALTVPFECVLCHARSNFTVPVAMGIMPRPKPAMIRCPSCGGKITVYYQAKSDEQALISKVSKGWYEVSV